MLIALKSEFTRTCLRYGLCIGLAWFVGNLIKLLLVFQGEGVSIVRIVGPVQLVIALVCMALGIRSIRKQSANNALSFGRGLGAGMLITVFWGLSSTFLDLVYTIFFLKWNRVNSIIDLCLQRDALVRVGIPIDSQLSAGLDAAMHFVDIYLHPVSMGMLAILGTVFWGAFPALIFAVVLRRKPAASAEPD
jgi:hypothetical protein